jgi:hypothetical protein
MRWSVRVAAALFSTCAALVPAGAAIPSPDGTYHGCYLRGAGVLRLIDSPGEHCRRWEVHVSWNLRGPAGPAGDRGPAGQPGAGVTVTVEPRGASCLAGGLRITDGAGAMAYVCNGTPGDEEVAVCRGRPGGSCSVAPRACAYDRDCPAGETCVWAQPFARFLDNGNGTVTDRRTCLTWEKKTGVYSLSAARFCDADTDCDPHDVNNVYSWHGLDATFDMNGSVTTSFLRKLNAAAFAGHTDWRLPTAGDHSSEPTGNDPELDSILLPASQCSAIPCIDPVFGPTAGGPLPLPEPGGDDFSRLGMYWTSSNTGTLWIRSIAFALGGRGGGEGGFTGAFPWLFYARAVRGP